MENIILYKGMKNPVHKKLLNDYIVAAKRTAAVCNALAANPVSSAQTLATAKKIART